MAKQVPLAETKTPFSSLPGNSLFLFVQVAPHGMGDAGRAHDEPLLVALANDAQAEAPGLAGVEVELIEPKAPRLASPQAPAPQHLQNRLVPELKQGRSPAARKGRRGQALAVLDVKEVEQRG